MTALSRFITFEGGEGAGKSTQARRLADRLRASGHRVTLTREPGGSPFAETLRTAILAPVAAPPVPLAQALAFYAARADHLASTIRPALAAGDWSICDRFNDSTRVYQGVAGGLPAAVLDQLDAMVVGPDQPSLTFVLDLPAELGLKRVATRRSDAQQPNDAAPPSGGADDMFEARDLAFHAALRAGFITLVAANPARCVQLDATTSVDDLADRVWSVVAARFKLSPESR